MFDFSPPAVPDFVKFYQLAASLAREKQDLTSSDVIALLQEFNQRVTEIETAYKYHRLQYACTRDKDDLQNQHECWLNELPSYTRAKAVVYHRLRSLQSDPDLASILPAPELMAQAVASFPLNHEQIANELRNIDDIQQFFYRLSFSDGVEEFAIWDRDKFFSQTDKRRRHMAYQSVAETMLAEQKQLLELYSKMISGRANQAKTGNLQYRAYTAITSSHSDLGIQELKKFREEAGELLKPVVAEILRQRSLRLEKCSYAERMLFLPEAILNTVPGNDTHQKFLPVLRAILGDASESFLVHLERGNFTEAAEMTFWLGEESSVIPQIPLVFLHLPHSKDASSVQQLFANCGHALADVSAMLNFPDQRYIQQPHMIKELSALIMAYIGGRYSAWFFNDDTNAANLYNDSMLCKELCRASELLAIDEFEDHLYEFGNIPLEVDQIWQSVYAKYFPDSEFALDNYFAEGKAWQLEVNSLLSAYSSLHRVLALITLLAEMPHYDRRNHLEKKLNNLWLSHPATPLLQRLKRAGFASPLESETIKRAVFAAADILEL